MKKALFLLLFLSVGQIFFPCRAEIYSFVKGKIQRNDTSYVVTHHEWPDEKVKPYSDVATLSIKANSKTYELKLQNYKGWEGGEGGDFRVIKLYHKGNLILEFVDEEAWIGEKVRDRGGVTPFSEFSEEVGKHATYNEYCLIYPLENNATALLFEGYSWSSQVPLLTIIVIKDNKAEVVFNQPWSVEFFSAKPKGFELVLIANFLQWGEGPEYDIWGSDRHKLYTTPEGTMKFEKLSEEEEMCSLDFLTKGTWEFRFSTEEGPFNRDESSRIEATYSTTTQTSILKSPERGEIVHHARYYLSKTLQSSFDESKVGKSLRGNYICVEDTANNGVNNYEIKGYTSDILTLKLVNEKNPTYTNTFFRITENPKEAKDKIETDKVYQVVEKMPEFPGGKQRLLNWVMKNIQYPAEARKKGIQGRVVITFVINKNGKAVEPLIVQSVDPLLDKEAIRLVNSMPKWKAGEEKGEPVRVKFTMPINFRLSGGNLRK